MNEAFVENAENDVDSDERGKDEDGLIRQRYLECGRSALKSSLDAGRHIEVGFGGVDGVNSVAEGGIGREIERESDDGKLALMIQGEGSGISFDSREGRQRNLRAVRGVDINIFERIGILLKLRVHFHDDVILIELRINGGDLTLAEGVVQGVVDVGGKNA